MQHFYLKIKTSLQKISRQTWLSMLGVFLLAVFLFCIFWLRIYHIDGQWLVELGEPKDSLVIVEGNKFVQRFFLHNRDFDPANKRVGWITDIHADRFKRRTVDSGTLYPKQYLIYLPKVFEALRAQGIDTVITSGDNTNSGDDGYAFELAKIAQQKRMHLIWTRGNHDNDKVMNILAPEKSKYYFVDYANTRFVALDDVESGGDYNGSIEQAQLAWLKEVLQTERPVIISMHIPIFDGGVALTTNNRLQGEEFTDFGGVLNNYQALESTLEKYPNVKLVLSGHWHVPWHRELSGINYFGQAALTRESYTGAYGVIDLQNQTVKYLFAK